LDRLRMSQPWIPQTGLTFGHNSGCPTRCVISWPKWEICPTSMGFAAPCLGTVPHDLCQKPFMTGFRTGLLTKQSEPGIIYIEFQGNTLGGVVSQNDVVGEIVSQGCPSGSVVLQVSGLDNMRSQRDGLGDIRSQISAEEVHNPRVISWEERGPRVLGNIRSKSQQKWAQCQSAGFCVGVTMMVLSAF